MADRGTYRAIKVVLLDGPDFQQLPERARWVFLTLKMSLGPSGIEVHYPEALAYQLSARTDAPVQSVKEALDLLEDAGWIRREANIIWIVGQLEHDPHINPVDAKHRRTIQRHVTGLPRLTIVRDFIEAHPDFFPPDEDDWTKGLPRAIEGPTQGETSVGNIPSKGHRRAIEGPTEGHRRAIEGPTQGETNVENTPSKGLPRASEGPTEGHRRAIEGPSKGLPSQDQCGKHPFEAPITEDRRPSTEERGEKTTARARAKDFPPGGDGHRNGDDPPHPGRRLSASQVLEAWASAQPVEVSAAERRKQKPFARRIADGHTREQVMAAFVGIGQLFPHCAPKNQPWDLSDLDRKFSKAVAAARDHPEIVERAQDAEFLAALEGAR